MIDTTPNRASDAGPDAGEPMDWRDRLYAAGFATEAAWKAIDEDETDAQEYARRLRAIEEAIDHLNEAKALLPRPKTAAQLAAGVI